MRLLEREILEDLFTFSGDHLYHILLYHEDAAAVYIYGTVDQEASTLGTSIKQIFFPTGIIVTPAELMIDPHINLYDLINPLTIRFKPNIDDNIYLEGIVRMDEPLYMLQQAALEPIPLRFDIIQPIIKVAHNEDEE